MKYGITLIPGDGIGPEVTAAAKLCVDTVSEKHGFDVEWDVHLAGQGAMDECGSVLPKETINSIRKNRIALKGPLTTPVGEGFRSVNVELRQMFDLFANVRPARHLPGVPCKFPEIDLIVVRENTEDVYAGIEFDAGSADARRLLAFVRKSTGRALRKDSAIAIKPISRFASRRIAKFAFELAQRKKRKKVTAVHKANIMKLSDGMFLRSAQAVAKGFPEIEFEDRIVDNMCMQLVEKPRLYDILLCPNLYGDILSDLCAGLSGGIGLAPSANIGKGRAIFEPVHGSAPKYAGKDKANPTACILSAAMMLEYIGLPRAALDLENAVIGVLKEGQNLTYDLYPTNPVGTKEMALAIAGRIRRR
jgi:isocitrate dehydrogenase (NAD+)